MQTTIAFLGSAHRLEPRVADQESTHLPGPKNGNRRHRKKSCDGAASIIPINNLIIKHQHPSPATSIHSFVGPSVSPFIHE
eukprot:354286-Chlamydomonas_euryale.AAC.3